MTTDPAHRRNIVGAAWMIAAMAAFAVEDALVKAVSDLLPVGQILTLFGLGGAAIFAGIALRQGDALVAPDVFAPAMRIRVLFEITGRLFYVLALALIPLSTATVILQATPLVVVASAALIFGERVGWRRWTAIGLGLFGVMIILRPGTEGFSALSLLALVGMLGFAGRDLASRAAPRSLSTAILGLYGFLALAVAGLLFSVWQGAAFRWPDARAAVLLVGIVLIGIGAYSCLMKAMRTGDVSAVTPFRYTRLLFGTALGIAVFGETLTLGMLVGSGLIVLSGLFILWRGQKASLRPGT
ncbi:EamA-like transporter family protein [Paracoccus tibetensis]|uniref:EamA-like transporter family protein n=2 Tax=Paracoccus tibetensis TaxID=336292 RepID=A0A1G5I6I7_9RHOB|nr:DMT family transporter [Paracoccus tibetensis]SCY71269.1 EamA-like transporter family protein [Paracoccus tibetensis]